MYREYYKLFFCKHSNVMNGIFFLTLELVTKIQAWDTKRYAILINLKRTANNGTHLPDIIKWWLNPFLLNNLHKPFHLVAQAGIGKVGGNRNKIVGIVGKDCYFFPAFPNANLGRRDSWRGACKKKKKKETGILCPTLCDPMNWTISQSLLKFMSIELVMPSNSLIVCHPLLLLSSIFPSIRSFPMSRLFPSVAKVLQLQHQSFQRIFRVNFL